MDNPFRSKSKKELEQEAIDKKAAEEKFQKAVDAAKTCLASKDFAIFKETAFEAREALIRTMIDNMDTDPLKFAFMAKTCLAKIDVLDQIIVDVNLAARRGK